MTTPIIEEEIPSHTEASDNAQATIPADSGEPNPWLEKLIQGATTVLIVVLCLVVYHTTIGQAHRQRYAFVDITDVLNLKELQVTVTAMRPGAGEEGQTKAFEEVAKFGKEVERHINDLQQECGCSFFVKAAVVKPAAAEDLTPELKRRLGIDNLNMTELSQQLRAIGGVGTPNSLKEQKK